MTQAPLQIRTLTQGGQSAEEIGETIVVWLGGARVRPWFCPGRGRELAHQIARASTAHSGASGSPRPS